MNRSLALAAALSIVALGVSGCTGPAEPVDEPDPAPSASADGGSGDAVAGGPECLVGEWAISEAEMSKFYDAVGAASGADFTITGGTGLTFTADSFTYTPNFTLAMDLSGVAGSGRITGSVGGAYSATEDTITTDVTSSDVVMTINVGGVEQDASALFGDLVTGAPINDSPYTCTPDGPLIGFDTGSGYVDIQLSRA